MHLRPGLSSHLLSVVLVVATQAKGSVLIHQKMFESRLFFVDKLIDMGAADYIVRPVSGSSDWTVTVTSVLHEDDVELLLILRAGIALLIAALSAVVIAAVTISNRLIEVIRISNSLGAFWDSYYRIE